VIASGTLPELVDRTVGRHRVVTVRTDAPVETVPAGLEADAGDPRTLQARVTDVARDLPRILASVAASGRSIEDVEVKAPSLQSVFIHLTGRELRE
jgi:ABC-2 type transport system ATP-binding protein